MLTVNRTDIQILTAHEDDGGNYHSQGGVHTGPSITGDRMAGMNTTEEVIIPTTIRLQTSPYLFYIPHPFQDRRTNQQLLQYHQQI